MNNSVQLLSHTLCKYHFIFRGFELFPHFLLQLFTFSLLPLSPFV